MEFASAAALVLRRLTAAGHGELSVSPRSREVEVGHLVRELADPATAIAARFGRAQQY